MSRQLTIQELEAELKRYALARGKDQKLSVRKLATNLGIVPSTLQKIINGERRLGPRLAREIALKIDVDISRSPAKGKRSSRFWKRAFDANSGTQMNWLNLAILETLKLADFEPSVSWIANRLGVPVETVKQAVAKLVDEKLLRISPDGEWTDLLGDASSGANGYHTTDQFRRTQKELLALSTQMLDRLSYDQREHGFSILPISDAQLPKLKQKIQKFQFELCEFAQKAKAPKNQVYAIEVGFFPLTKGSAHEI